MWQALYKAAKKRFDAEPEFKARAREAVTQLQSGNELFLQARLSVICCFLHSVPEMSSVHMHFVLCGRPYTSLLCKTVKVVLALRI